VHLLVGDAGPKGFGIFFGQPAQLTVLIQAANMGLRGELGARGKYFLSRHAFSGV
jgi:hypothetical protein